MDEQNVEPKGSIDRYVLPYIDSLADLSGQAAIDIPSGKGRASFMFALRQTNRVTSAKSGPGSL